MMPRHLLSLFLLASVSAISCRASLPSSAPAAPPATTQPAATWISSSLYFGFGSASGPTVSEWRWQDFIETEIAPRFPAGFTLVPAQGYWRDDIAGMSYREQSIILIVLHDGSADAEDKLETLRERFKSRFNQQAVLRVDSPAGRVRF